MGGGYVSNTQSHPTQCASIYLDDAIYTIFDKRRNVHKGKSSDPLKILCLFVHVLPSKVLNKLLLETQNNVILVLIVDHPRRCVLHHGPCHIITGTTMKEQQEQ
jgi:hypothetical protein